MRIYCFGISLRRTSVIIFGQMVIALAVVGVLVSVTSKECTNERLWSMAPGDMCVAAAEEFGGRTSNAGSARRSYQCNCKHTTKELGGIQLLTKKSKQQEDNEIQKQKEDNFKEDR